MNILRKMTLLEASMDEKEKMVLDAMKNAGKPVRPGDVAKAAEMDSKEVSKIIDSLKKKGLVISPKRCYYSPTEG
jgi:DNA-binding MarR family transcriptional regulator